MIKEPESQKNWNYWWIKQPYKSKKSLSGR